MGLLAAVGLLSLLCVSEGAPVGPFTSTTPGRSTQHNVAGTLSFPNANNIVITHFSYDGQGVEVFLYFYRPGQAQSGSGGTVISVRSRVGERFESNQVFNRQNVTFAMPSGETVCNIQTLTVWCRPFDAIFGQVTVNRAEVFVNSGNGECQIFGGDVNLPDIPPTSFDNCIPFSSSLQLRWTVDTPNNEIDFEICSCRSANPAQNQYMGFGLSGNPGFTFMVNADATIAWLDNQTGKPNAVDYFITGRSQCRGGQGVCPDTAVAGRSCVNNIDSAKLRGGTRSGQQQCVTFSRNFTTGDSECDIDFNVTNPNQYIVWAIGGLGETAFIHFERSDSTSAPLFLGRTGVDECTNNPIVCATCTPYQASTMVLKSNTTLRVTIGPSAQERGYMGITGQAGWGISWYVNGTLIPELVLTRGMTYTFIVEGGNDPSDLATYHPFYITNSKGGGRIRNSVEQQREEIVYAGFNGDIPTGVGRLCQSEETATSTAARENCMMNEADYFNSLPEPSCLSGEPGMITWTPDDSTPDTVYYQCATHRNLGWKITLGATPTEGAPPTTGSMITLGAPPTIPVISLFILVLLSLLASVIV